MFSVTLKLANGQIVKAKMRQRDFKKIKGDGTRRKINLWMKIKSFFK